MIYLLPIYLAVTGVVVLVTLGKIKPAWWLVYLITLAAILPVTTHSSFLAGADIHLEYYFASQALDGWNINYPNPVNSAMGITVITPFLSKIGIPIEVTFKWIMPAIFCFTPAILYQIYKRFVTDKKEAFLSVFYFISFPAVLMEIPAITREMLASPFLALFFFAILSRLSIKYKLLAMIGSGLAVILFHYSLGLVMVATLFMYVIFMVIFKIRIYPKRLFRSVWTYHRFNLHMADKWTEEELRKEQSLMPTYTAFFFIYDLFIRNFRAIRIKHQNFTPVWVSVVALVILTLSMFGYYGNVAGGTPIRFATALIPIEEQKVGFLTIGRLANPGGILLTGRPPEYVSVEPLSEEQPVTTPGYTSLMKTALGLDFMEVSTVGKAFRIIQYITQILLLIGVIYFLTRFKRLNFSIEYLVLSLVCVGLLLLCIALPGFSAVLNASRWFHLTLFILAPMVVIGAKAIFNK